MLSRTLSVSLVILGLSLLLAIASTRYLYGNFSPSIPKRFASGAQKAIFNRMDTERKIPGVKRVMLFGATGMVGSGALRECLLDPDVEQVITVGRTPTGQVNDKLREVTLTDFSDFASIDDELKNIDACFYSLGVSSTVADKESLERINKDYTLNAANALIRHNPNATFVFVSGVGSDAESKTHWAKVKGETENVILEMPWNGYVFRPGVIRAMNGENTRIAAFKYLYILLKPVVALTHMIAPSLVTTTEDIGRGFLHLSKYGSHDSKRIFENNEISLITQPQKTPSL